MRFVVLITLISVVCACGIKGKPLPPLPEEPLVTTDEQLKSVSQPTTAQPLKALPKKKKNR